MKMEKILKTIVTQYPRWAGVDLRGPSGWPTGHRKNNVFESTT
jgi:hypothetical protein